MWGQMLHFTVRTPGLDPCSCMVLGWVPWLPGFSVQAFWMGESGSYNQPLCELSQSPTYPPNPHWPTEGCRTCLWPVWLTDRWASQAELPADSLARQCYSSALRWSELLSVISSLVSLQAWLKERYVATWFLWLASWSGKLDWQLSLVINRASNLVFWLG